MSPRERARIEYDIESLRRAIDHERNVRNRNSDVESQKYAAVVLQQLFDEVRTLKRRLKPKRRAPAR